MMRREVSRRVRHKTVPNAIKFVGTVGEREVKVVASDATPDRMGDVLEPNGCDLSNYRRNPIVLAQHDSAEPIAKCSTIAVESGKLLATIQFPAPGVSAKSDLYCRLMKAGVVSAVSVGFLPLDWEPIRDGGYRFTKWEMLELSCVSVPANPSAVVLERSARRRGADDSDDAVPKGNCGRPLDKECGMKDKTECSIHGQGQIGFGDDVNDPQKNIREVLRMRRELDLIPSLRETSCYEDTVEGRKKHSAELRAKYGLKRTSPALQVADAKFRLQRF